MVIRTRLFDEFLHQAATSDQIRQVVLLGSGMDARAFRLSWPEGARLYELDRPEVLRLKDELLGAAGAIPACERHAIGSDLTGNWAGALQAAECDPAAPSAWLAEGVAVYLNEPDMRALLSGISRLAAPASRPGLDVLDVPNRAFFTSPWTRPTVQVMEQRGTPHRFATDRPEGLLAEFGWAAEVTVLGSDTASYGPLALPRCPPRDAGNAMWIPSHRHPAGLSSLNQHWPLRSGMTGSSAVGSPANQTLPGTQRGHTLPGRWQQGWPALGSGRGRAGAVFDDPADATGVFGLVLPGVGTGAG